MKYQFIGLVSLGLLAVSTNALAVCEIGTVYDAACQKYYAENAERLKAEAEAEAKAKAEAEEAEAKAKEEEIAKEEARKNLFAFDDEFVIFKSLAPDETITEVTGNVITNDGSGVLGTRMLSPLVSQYGRLDFDFGTGAFTYTLATDSEAYLALQENDEILDVFNYQVYGEYDFTDEARLIIHILGGKPSEVTLTNIEVEDNDRSAKATPLNSGQLIKGQLVHSDDQDWYSLASLGDEIIRLELCLEETSCGEIKDSLVLYAFDADKLTTAMENNTVRLDWYRKDTGAVLSSYQYNHLYLNGSLGVFNEALVGAIDPCLGNKRELNIGVSPGPRQYYVAISSVLTNSNGVCGNGNNILEKEGASFTETTVDPDTGAIIATEVTTTQEYTEAFSFSRDQYELRLTRTGINPLRFTDSEISEFNSETRILRVANVRVIDDLYEVDLELMGSETEIKIGQRFTILSSNHLKTALNGNPYQATYNRSNNVVKLPKVVYNFTDTNDIFSLATEIYSLELLYLPDEGQVEVTGIIKLNPF